MPWWLIPIAVVILAGGAFIFYELVRPAHGGHAERTSKTQPPTEPTGKHHRSA